VLSKVKLLSCNERTQHFSTEFFNIHNGSLSNVNMSPRYARPNASSMHYVAQAFPRARLSKLFSPPLPSQEGFAALALQHHAPPLARPKPRRKDGHTRLPTTMSWDRLPTGVYPREEGLKCCSSPAFAPQALSLFACNHG
jgi:hypothetical protein